MDLVLPAESTKLFFKGEVERAMVNQHVKALPETTYHLVELLSRFAESYQRMVEGKRPGVEGKKPAKINPNEPLGVAMVKALDACDGDQRLIFRQVGDFALFIAGFFSDSLRRSLVDVDYYLMLGHFSYLSLSALHDESKAQTYRELGSKISAFAEVLEEVSEGFCLNYSDQLRLWEKYARTGSPRVARKLEAMGLDPRLCISTDKIQ
jgi:hypothetical protein